MNVTKDLGIIYVNHVNDVNVMKINYWNKQILLLIYFYFFYNL